MSKRTLVAATAAALVVLVVAGVLLVVGRGDGDGSAAAPESATPTPSLPLRTESVPAPSGGTVQQTVQPGKPGKTIRAGADQTAELPEGVTVRLARTTTRDVQAGGPGESGGPAVVADVEITNDSERPIDVDTVMVTLTYGANRVATPLTAEPYAPFTGTLAPGESATGRYVFGFPDGRHGSFVIIVAYAAGAGVARFGGAAS